MAISFSGSSTLFFRGSILSEDDLKGVSRKKVQLSWDEHLRGRGYRGHRES